MEGESAQDRIRVVFHPFELPATVRHIAVNWTSLKTECREVARIGCVFGLGHQDRELRLVDPAAARQAKARRVLARKDVELGWLRRKGRGPMVAGAGHGPRYQTSEQCFRGLQLSHDVTSASCWPAYVA